MAAMLLLAMLLPLMLLIAASIAAAGQNPLFRQGRIGYMGRVFRIAKFRTIWAEDAVLPSPAFWRPYQRRLFQRLSAVLRATGLDELPQLLNVARGEMALIGPRPLVPEEHDRLPAGRDIRTTVLPGVTGLAQVNGGQHLSAERKLVFDIYYVQRKSAVLDAVIVGRTVMRLLGFSHITDSTDLSVLHMAERHAAGHVMPMGYDAATVRVPVSRK